MSIYGGTISEIWALDFSRVFLHGYSFELGDGLWWDDDGETLLGTGLLSGTWYDGTGWSNWTTEIIQNDDAATIRAIFHQPPASLVSITPSSAPQGTSVAATLRGEFTSFNNDGSTILDVWLSQDDSKIDGTDFQSIDATTIAASFNIPADAPIGRWDVNVNCSGGGHLIFEEGFMVYKHPDLNGDGRVN